MTNSLQSYVLCVVLAMTVLMGCAPQQLGAETISVLVVYDAGAKTWADNNAGGMNTFAANAIAKMNQAMANSGVDLTFTLAFAGNVPYAYKDFTSDLINLQSGAGTLAIVHEWRDTYQADVVVMLADTGSAYGWVGLGYQLCSMSGSADYAYTINSIRSVDISHTMTHEVGHNLGCHHSKAQTTQPGPNNYLNSYSAGYYFTGTNNIKYHTIMAYNVDGYGNTYMECPQFSSPLLSYQGVPGGHEADGDNARNIRETMAIVAAYRSEPSDTCPNDHFANAAMLSGISGVVSGNTEGATSENCEPAHDGYAPGKSMWYKFTPAQSGMFSVNTHGSSFDTVLAVYAGSTVGSLNLGESNDDDGVGPGNSGISELFLTGGTTYRIAVDGFWGSSGDVVLAWNFVPAIIPAVMLGGGGVNIAEDRGSCAITVSLSEVSVQTVTVNLLFSGTAVQAVDYTCSSTNIVIPAGQISGTMTLTAVQDYLVEADETVGVGIASVMNATNGGVQQVSAMIEDDDFPPVNDGFVNAVILSGDAGSVSGNSCGAAAEAGEPAHAGLGPFNSVWYTFTPSANGKLTIDTHGSAFDTVLAVYTGGVVGQLKKIAANDDDWSARNNSGLKGITLTGGVTYRVAVAGCWATSVGAYLLNWTFTPAVSRLTVVTPCGQANPPSGTNSFVSGSAVSVAVTALPAILGNYQYVCKGWTGTGSVPAKGATTNTPTFVLTNDSSIVWNWQTNCLLQVEPVANGQTSLNTAWLPVSTNIQITATPAPYYVFVGWQGQTNGCVMEGASITVAMSESRTISPLFMPELTTNAVPKYWLAQYGLTNFTSDAMTDVDHDGMSTWQEWVAGCDPTNNQSVFRLSHMDAGPGQGMILRWPSVSNRFYSLSQATNLLAGANAFVCPPDAINMPATPPENVYTNFAAGAGTCFYKIDVRE